MNRTFLHILFLSCLSSWTLPVFCQNDVPADTVQVNSIEKYKEEARSLVSFIEYSFNILGDPQTTTKEKDVIIHESYLKVFRDKNVQIEDDLDDERDMVTYKDIQAYLKDITFFFKHVTFEFQIDNITHHLTAENKLYLKANMTRILKGVDIEGKPVQSRKFRYMEINLDEDENILKTVSMYTTKISEEEELANWWNVMPTPYKTYFAKDIWASPKLTMKEVMDLHPGAKLMDSVVMASGEKLMLNQPITFQSIREITKREDLDLSSRPNLTSIEPLAKFTNLKRLNISHTQVGSLMPLRNLVELEVLDCSYTSVKDLSPLRYAEKLKDLNIERTLVENLTPLIYLENLEKFNCQHSRITDLTPVSQLKKLTDLRCAHSQITSLKAVEALQNLKYLYTSHTKLASLQGVTGLPSLELIQCEYCPIKGVEALVGLPSLKFIFADNTQIASLDPLLGLPSLSKVYCDNTPVSKSEASRFMMKKPGVLVIYQSTALLRWWDQLRDEWRNVLKEYAPLDESPTKEQLQLLVNIDTIDVRENDRITSLDPLSEFRSLKVLLADKTGISSLGPLRELMDLEVVSCNHTRVNSLAPLAGLTNLREINCRGTLISSLDALKGLDKLEKLDISQTAASKIAPLAKLSSLTRVYADDTQVTKTKVLALLDSLPNCLVIYQTPTLLAWWEGISPAWQTVFRTHTPASDPPAIEELHKFTLLEEMDIQGMTELFNLVPLEPLVRLKRLSFTNTKITSLLPLRTMPQLEELRFKQNPITDLEPLTELKNLKVLDCANTPVEDLEFIEHLVKLEELNVSGTQIKDLKSIEPLFQLKRLDCYNTDVKNLKPLEELTNLISLQCYNTKIPTKKVLEFKLAHPNVSVVHY